MSDADTRTRVTIGLPLPLDVWSSIGNAIEAMYPGTMIDTRSHPGGQTLILGERVRAKPLSKKAANAARVDPDPDGFRVDFNGFHHGTLHLLTPLELAQALVPSFKAILDEHDAPNYVEWDVTGDGGTRYVLSVARSRGQTPGALRARAENELEAARTTIARQARIIDSVRAVIESGAHDDAAAAGEPHEPCDLSDEHDCHATARHFLRTLVENALDGNDTALRVREQHAADAHDETSD